MDITENIQLANKFREIGNFPEACKICLNILKLYPNNIETLYCFGLAAFNIEKYDISETCFRTIIELDPSNIKAPHDLENTLQEKRLLQKVKADHIPVNDIKTVCLILGPYRNLTSLIAGILFLHPTCQVLNHAGMRIFHKPDLNFLYQYNLSKFNAFLKYAICISGGGQRGPFGGSITFEHSFDYANLQKSYHERFGNSLIKEKIDCLIWKESSKTASFIKMNNIDLGDILKQNNKLKFLLPIRNPLDCAESNINTKHVVFNPNLNANSSFEEVLEGIMQDLLWFLSLQKKFPDSFFHFFENRFDEAVLLNLASFLKIEKDALWIKEALFNFQIKKRYSHTQNKVDFYQRLVEKYFKDDHDSLEQFLSFS